MPLSAGTLIGPGTSFNGYPVGILSQSVDNYKHVYGTPYGPGSGIYGLTFVQHTVPDGVASHDIYTPMYGWDDTGAAILAGQTSAVPEPDTLAMWAAGAACVAGAARRRRAQLRA